MRLSERIPHDSECNAVYKPDVEPSECDCWVSKVAQLEEKLAAFRTEAAQLGVDYAKLEAENAALKRLLTSMTCGECDETMLDCTCPDTKSLLTAEEPE